MSESEDDSFGQREVAYRLFAAEFEDADLSYSEGDDDRSPNYVITPTGARVNRLFAVGVLTEVGQVSDDVLRGRVVDPTGAFVTYAGQYQPDVQAFLERVETPTFVAMTGKARTFQPEDTNQVYTSVRPESINEVDAETRDRWTVQAAEQTLDRIGHMATALALGISGDSLEETLLDQGFDEGLASGIPIALDHYGTTPAYLDALRDLALDAARVVAGEKDEVGDMRVAPDEPGSVSASELADSSVDVSEPAESQGKVDESEPQEPETVTSGANTTTESPETTESSTTDKGDSSSSPAETPEPDSTSQTERTTEGDGDMGAVESSSVEEPEQTASTAVTDTAETQDAETEVSGGSDDLGDFDPDEFELEEETREQVKEEYGTEFQTGSEVDEPGEADIETPETQDGTSAGESAADEKAAQDTGTLEQSPQEVPEPAEQETEKPDTQSSESPESEEAEDPETETTESSESEEADEPDEPDEPDDLQTAVVELMGEIDEGDGADKEMLVDEMINRYGVDADATEDAIQEALMSGECYEPTDGTLKPI